MQKEFLAVFIAVALVGIIGFAAEPELTGNWFKAPRMSSYRQQYRPPPVYSQQVQQAPIRTTQRVVEPPIQINPTQFLSTVVTNYLNIQKDRNFCLANCVPTIMGNCAANLQNMPAGTNCAAIINSHIGVCMSGCNSKFPQNAWGLSSSLPQQVQQPQINPQEHLSTLVNNYLSSQHERNFCLANCPVIIRSNCLANVRFMPAGTQCDAIVSQFINDCIKKCDTKFPQVQQVPVQPAPQLSTQTMQECSNKCEDGAALLYKQCMDQGAGEVACQNVGKLQKESCTKKCVV